MFQFLIFVISLILLIAMIGMGSPIGIFSSLLICLVIITFAMISFASWKNRGISTLWLIATSIKNNLPLPELIDAQATEFRGSRGRKLLELADQLREGVALPIAIDQYRSLVPSQGQLAIRVGGETGTLGESLDVTARYLDRSRDPDRYSYYYLIFYLIFVLLAILAITSFLLYFIIPKYKEIFQGFGTQLPNITLLVISLGDWGATNFFLLFLTVIFCSLVFIAACFRRFRGSTVNRSKTWIDSLITFPRVFYQPFTIVADFILSFFPKRVTPEILRLLSVSAEAGKPLIATVDSLSRHFPFPDIRKRMSRVRLSVEQGTEFWQAMSQQRIVTAHQAAILRAGERSNQLGFLLRETSNSMEATRLHHRFNFWEIARCVLLVAMTFLVALIAIGMFYPLISLIHDLS
ncbi:type II secretion system F family protein [Rubinisphaera italica]|uniref:Putative type II secretion system protein F n=1 Tax=Rubinisphaera italica TaxID=2527969 RepID=A0A5C5XEM9_9PLAN|nr:type II secretion system F family protein [Rubinisphaera italica]TWT61248.1 putative type II secretion system protein F [Rubinisphaera italica]